MRSVNHIGQLQDIINNKCSSCSIHKSQVEACNCMNIFCQNHCLNKLCLSPCQMNSRFSRQTHPGIKAWNSPSNVFVGPMCSDGPVRPNRFAPMYRNLTSPTKQTPNQTYCPMVISHVTLADYHRRLQSKGCKLSDCSSIS